MLDNIFQIRYFDSLESTQETAKELAGSGAFPWTVVVAGQQVKGHGKETSRWFSPKGSLYFSVILPKSNFDDLQTITILAAFIISKTIKEEFKIEPMIKLPNDVLIDGKKICGILTQNVISGKNISSSVIGIGLNTNGSGFPEELNAISLKDILGKEVDNDYLLQKILLGLKKQLETITH
ncbi:MAG TPA: biotin--[acetyl-CoA-carboxylase] ligase [Candidatus Pacearchaeota archaeon]|nr:biotin--[acetyl-CoA-carboxylase] ligase [Candidatus Parcubacteria bacterium]HNZ83925.1 biotin--[acetyl-CoA-carboxylase] ligase [Candidatus Pacearchaeota archaeon]HOU45683.1 biotin--[acetyl-CoA-carboxylase] ligase [Candidatus Pacearchaeota archaeon]HPM08502.1 biotin--[acetyl-CoA-carboxylase] ligase [Candidatus Pacearchaeota archaeon]HQI74612.1 biotin--[acetyl-CoA-carboxylase] ligase [Candidatus Pacearchaeota archaeon]